MDTATREIIRQRAGYRCEYCRLPETSAPFFAFHVEHVRAKQHRGGDEAENLALACPFCNRFKGPNLSAIDPETDALVPVFNPRTQSWQEHFAITGAEIVGRTSVGRATAALLNMNQEPRLEMRFELLRNGEL
jgi:5-methylcytosine-specific restriction endonuclease McrA